MATDFSIRIDADISEITADDIADLAMELLAAIRAFGVTIAHEVTAGIPYSEGTSVDNIELDVGKGGTVTEDWGFRIMIDSAVSKNDHMEIIERVIGVVRGLYTIDTIAFNQTFSEGDGVFQYEATIA